MMKYRILCMLFGLMLWAGCADEDALKPLGVEEPFLNLPQGDNDYDDRIMQLFEDYGVSIFYKFSPQDVYFDYTTGASSELSTYKVQRSTTYYPYEEGDETDETATYFVLNETQDSIHIYSGNSEPDEEGVVAPIDHGAYAIGTWTDENGLTTTVTVDYKVDGSLWSALYEYEEYKFVENSFSVECADADYINKQLDMLETILLGNYSEDMLKAGMPPRIMLGKQLQQATASGNVFQSYMNVNNNFIMSHGDFTIDTLSTAELRNLKNGLNVWFLAEGMVDELYEDILANTDFFTYTDYATLTNKFGYNKNYQPILVSEYGLCLYGLAQSELLKLAQSATTIAERQRLDLKSFLSMMISYPESYLAEPVAYVAIVSGFKPYAYNLEDPHGRLSQEEGQDLSGKIRAKYDALVDYLMSIGVNIEAMSTAYWEEPTE